MKRAYYYLYYKFFKMSEAAPSRWLSDWKAGVIIIFLELLLVFSLINYYNIFFDRYFNLTNVYVVSIAIILFGFNYYIFLHKDKWKKYAEEFEQLPKSKNHIGSIIVGCIVVLLIANLVFFLLSDEPS